MVKRDWLWVVALGAVGWYLYRRSHPAPLSVTQGTGPTIPVGINGTVNVPVDALTSLVVSALKNLSPL